MTLSNQRTLVAVAVSGGEGGEGDGAVEMGVVALVLMMRVASGVVVADEMEAAGGGKRRVEESGGGDRIDPVMRSVFGVGRKSPPEKFSDGGGVETLKRKSELGYVKKSIRKAKVEILEGQGIEGLGLGFGATSVSGIGTWTTEGWTYAVLPKFVVCTLSFVASDHVPLPSEEVKK
ncbi:hypothetical protein Tco_0276576 [Tanacetum coccineum]